MGIDMSSVDNPNGFQIWGELLRQNLYAVQTQPVINVFHNDMVIHGGTALATKFGVRVIIEDSVIPDGTADTQKILGAVTAVFDEDMNPVKYIAAAATGDDVVAGYIMVADHPLQEFLIQENGTTNAIDLADIGQNCDIVSVAICAGTAATGISTQELASDLVSANAALDVKILYPHPDDTVEDDTDCHARWIVQINTHYNDSFHAGA